MRFDDPLQLTIVWYDRRESESRLWGFDSIVYRVRQVFMAQEATQEVGKMIARAGGCGRVCVHKFHP